MGYRVWNNYEEENHRAWREHVVSLQLADRVALMARNFGLAAVMIGLPVLILLALLLPHD